ncbi:Uncharacterised protein [Bordetella pertussis]|nr:Uncharacterised protein [Bordetella pertussis]
MSSASRKVMNSPFARCRAILRAAYTPWFFVLAIFIREF